MDVHGMTPSGLGGPEPQYPALSASLSTPSTGLSRAAFSDRLSQIVHHKWARFRDFHQQQIKPRLDDCLRRRKGEYSASVLAEIAAYGGTTINPNITGTKIAGLNSWIRDVLLPANGDKPYAIEPTPMPDVPMDVVQSAVTMAMQSLMPEYEMVQQVAAADPERGAMLRQELASRAADIGGQAFDAGQQEVQRQLEDRTDAMARLVDDILTEANFRDALLQFVDDLSTYPLAILKGPILEGHKVQQWTQDGTPEVVVKPTLTFRTVSPYDFFPCPGARDIASAAVIERTTVTVGELATISQSPGWVRDAVDRVLRDYVFHNLTHLNATGTTGMDNERNRLLSMPIDIAQYETNQIEIIELHDVFSGKDLLDWSHFNETTLEQFGFKNVRADSWYSAVVTDINGIAVKVAPELDPLGRHPYMTSSYEVLNGGIWGTAMPEKMADCQDAYAAELRHVINNSAFASGPIVSYDEDAMSEHIKTLGPWQKFPYHGTDLNGRAPFHFHQPISYVDQFLKIAMFFEQQADERTGVMRYQYGSDKTGGAGSTATGLSMLIDASGRVIKRIVGDIDARVLRPAIERTVDFINRYWKDPSVKGDVRVVARGVLYMLTRDTEDQRRQGFLSLAEREAFRPFFRPEGIADALRQWADRADQPKSMIITDDQLRQYMATQEQMQAQEAQQTTAGATR